MRVSRIVEKNLKLQVHSVHPRTFRRVFCSFVVLFFFFQFQLFLLYFSVFSSLCFDSLCSLLDCMLLVSRDLNSLFSEFIIIKTTYIQCIFVYSDCCCISKYFRVVCLLDVKCTLIQFTRFTMIIYV